MASGRPRPTPSCWPWGRPTYPVDRGTYRILVRHGWIDQTAEYEEASELLSRQAAGNSQEIARLSILARAGWPPVLRAAIAQMPALSFTLRAARARSPRARWLGD